MLYEVAPVRRHAGGLHAFIAGLTPGTAIAGHRHDQPTMVLVVRGAVHVDEQGHEFLDTAATLSLCPPGLVRSIRSGAVGAECLIVTADASHPLARHGIWKTITNSHASRYDLGPLAAVFVDVLQRDTPGSAELEAVCIGLLTALLQRGERLRHAPPWLERALIALELSGGKSGSCRAVARQLGIHAVYLARVVRRHTGLSMRDYVRNARVATAVRLIETTLLPLTRIAHLVGFADQSHFTREFARRIGHVPSAHPRLPSTEVACVQVPDVPGVHLGRVSDQDHPANSRDGGVTDQASCS